MNSFGSMLSPFGRRLPMPYKAEGEGAASRRRRLRSDPVRKSVMPALALAVLCGLPSAPAAAAADEAAIVEDLRGPPTEVAPLDYLASGTVIHLNAQNVIVIDFLRSCTRETIHGGTVRVGALQSEVTDGRVERQKVNCDGGRRQVPATFRVGSCCAELLGTAAAARPAARSWGRADALRQKPFDRSGRPRPLGARADGSARRKDFSSTSRRVSCCMEGSTTSPRKIAA